MIKLFEIYEKSKCREYIERNPGLVAIIIGFISILISLMISSGTNETNFSANQKTSVIMLLPIATEVHPNEILEVFTQEF